MTNARFDVSPRLLLALCLMLACVVGLCLGLWLDVAALVTACLAVGPVASLALAWTAAVSVRLTHPPSRPFARAWPGRTYGGG